MWTFISLLLSCVLLGRTVNGFHPSLLPMKTSQLWSSTESSSLVEDSSGGLSHKTLTSVAQIKALRKEAARRRPHQYFLPRGDESLGPFRENTLSEISKILSQECELVEVHGLCGCVDSEKPNVYSTAALLAYTLEREIGKDVIVVSTKGFKATLYSPMDGGDDNPKKIKLHSSVGQSNAWTKRVKAERDNRGQIPKQ
jgi:hypothetical protein